MNEVTTLGIDAEKIASLNARLDKFEELLDIASAKLPNYVEKIEIAAKRVHLETESLREMKESLPMGISQTIKDELKSASVPLGNQLFATFSGCATTFWDHRFAAVNRANDDLKKTIHNWSNLSVKSIVLLTLASVLIGIATFFTSYYLMPSQKLTQNEIKCMYYGKAYVLNAQKFPNEINRVVAEEADKLIKSTTRNSN